MDADSHSDVAFDVAVESSSAPSDPAVVGIVDWLPAMIVLAPYVTLKCLGFFG